jgi:hypothetical protein
VAADVATGTLRVLDARVHEPVHCAKRGTVVFRDVLGVLECAAGGSDAPRLALTAPSGSPWFLRAAGEDERGNLLVWVYDREGARHHFWQEDRASGQGRAESFASGQDALRAWSSRQRGEAFHRAGSGFQRTLCLRFKGRNERACVEPLDGVSDRSFRGTLGLPTAVGEWVTHVWPTGWSIAPDSAAVLVGLLEADSGVRQSTTWIAGPERAKRIAISPLGRAAASDAWVRWQDATHALWVDGAGGLWRIDSGAARAEPRIAVTAPPRFPAAVPAVAAGATSAAIAGPRGRRAWVRTVPGSHDLESEIWIDVGGGERRLVARFGRAPGS